MTEPEHEDVPCEHCEGTGIVTFCPSEPDKCEGCEQMPCPTCKGTGRMTP